MIKSQRFVFSFLLYLFFSGFAQNALAQGTLDNRLSESTEEAEKQQEVKRYSGVLMALHYMGFGDERNEPSTLFIGQANYEYANWIFFASQYMQKLYYLDDSNENEFVFYDTWLGAMKLGKSPLGGKYQFRTRLTLPVSEYSMRNDIITKPDARIRNTWSFLDKKLSLVLGLESVLYVNEYTTTQTGARDGGLGMPLPLARLGLQSLAMYRLNSKMTASAYMFFLRRQYESLGPSNNVSGGNLPTHDFWYGFSLDYQVKKNLGAYVAFDHSNTLEQNGRVEFYTFDPLTSQWSLGLNYSF